MTKTKVPEILWPAQRQYRHNSGDDALVFGFDQYETVKVVTSLQKRITELEAERRRAMVHLEEMKRLYEESTDVDNLVAALTEACQIRLIFKSEGGADVK